MDFRKIQITGTVIATAPPDGLSKTSTGHADRKTFMNPENVDLFVSLVKEFNGPSKWQEEFSDGSEFLPLHKYQREMQGHPKKTCHKNVLAA